MKVYLVMELDPWISDYPVGACSTKERALAECKRLADALLRRRHRMRAELKGLRYYVSVHNNRVDVMRCLEATSREALDESFYIVLVEVNRRTRAPKLRWGK